MEQLNLFEETRHIEFANKILGILNSLDTRWKDTFYIDSVELEKWEHIESKEKELTIDVKTTLLQDSEHKENYFMMWNSEEDTKKFNKEICENEVFKKLNKDDDFSISPTPWNIFIFYHNFELKELSYESMETTKKV